MAGKVGTSLLAVRMAQRFPWALSMNEAFSRDFLKEASPSGLLADGAILELVVVALASFGSLVEDAQYLLGESFDGLFKRIAFSGNVLDLIISRAPPLSPPSAIHLFSIAAAVDAEEVAGKKRASLRQRTATSLANWAMRSLASHPSNQLYFYVPQLVQALRVESMLEAGESGLLGETILDIARESPLFAHQVIWNMRANEFTDEAGTRESSLAPRLRSLISAIEAHFSDAQAAFYRREFTFFAQVTAISGTLKPHVKTKGKEEKKALIDAELRKIRVDPGVYLPSNPDSILVDIEYSSGRPLQSAAKVLAISNSVIHL